MPDGATARARTRSPHGQVALVRPAGSRVPAHVARARANAVSQAVILQGVDMPAELQKFIIDLAADGLFFYNFEKDLCFFMKNELERKYPSDDGYWCVVCGKNYGSATTCEVGLNCYFYLDDWSFNVWKS